MSVMHAGSGKTLSFLIPIIVRVRALRREANESGQELGDGVKALVVSPTRELAAQQARVAQTLLPGSGLRMCLLTAATEAGSDLNKVDLLLANPLRVVHLLNKKRIDLTNTRYLVVDEADKLFEMGFMEQLDALLAAATHATITRALFSATLPERVEDLARTVLQVRSNDIELNA